MQKVILALIAMSLSGCAAPIVTTQSAGCSSLIPDSSRFSGGAKRAMRRR
jgi:uncharacterized protein YceK